MTLEKANAEQGRGVMVKFPRDIAYADRTRLSRLGHGLARTGRKAVGGKEPVTGLKRCRRAAQGMVDERLDYRPSRFHRRIQTCSGLGKIRPIGCGHF